MLREVQPKKISTSNPTRVRLKEQASTHCKACMDYLATSKDWLRIALPLSNGLFMLSNGLFIMTRNNV
jgi:hypothetical protein